MAESEDEQRQDSLLIAQVRAYFLNGEAVDLLPFKHATDVRAEIDKFISDWAKTGFLVKERFFYPWHQVKSVEVISVQEMTNLQAEPYLAAWREDTEEQKLFWKTRKPQDKEKEDDKSKE
jgi:hypothetical protein